MAAENRYPPAGRARGHAFPHPALGRRSSADASISTPGFLANNAFVLFGNIVGGAGYVAFVCRVIYRRQARQTRPGSLDFAEPLDNTPRQIQAGLLHQQAAALHMGP